MEKKDTLSSCSESEEQQMQLIQDKSKESCMVSFQRLHSHLKRLSNNDLKGSRTENGSEEADTLRSTLLCNGTESQEQDTSSRSGNDAHVDDADIRPIYNEEPMAEVQMTADDNVSATGQQHTEQPESNNEGEVDQNADQCYDTCPLPAKLTDDKTIELSNQLLEFENIYPNRYKGFHKRTSTVHEKTTSPRSCLRWQPTGRILKTVCLRWVPTGKIFTSSTTKVDSEPPNGSKEDITNQSESEQALDVSADISENRASRNFDLMMDTWCLLKLTLQAPSSLVLHQMTSAHNRSELGIHDHSNEPSSSKLVPKVVPLAYEQLVKDIRSQDGIDDKDNDKGSKSRSQSMKEQSYSKVKQRKRPDHHRSLNDKSNLHLSHEGVSSETALREIIKPQKIGAEQEVSYGKIWYDKDVLDLRSVDTEFPAIVFNDSLTLNETPSCEPTVSSLNDNEFDFRISFDKSDDEDYMVVFDKNSFSYKIISTNNLKTDSGNDNEKVNMPLFPSPEPSVSCIDDLDFFKDFENGFPAIVYNDARTSKSDFSTEPTLCPQHIDEFDLKDETLLSEYDEEEQSILYFNDLFPFNAIYPDELKSNTKNNNDKIDIEQSSGNLSVKPLHDVINTDVGAYAQGSNKLLETRRYGVSVPALTKDHEGNKIQYGISRRRQYAVFKLYGNKIFWKISNVVPTPRNPRYVVSKTLDTPYRPYSRPYK
ncbi:hypothetical protein Tco_1294921 [Tanacetum coccineum]